MAQDVQLICPNVNSGTAVVFQGATLNYAWQNLTRTTPLTGQFTIAETQVSGYENPKIVITGFIDTNQSTTNIVTQSLLQDFASVAYQSGDSDTHITLSVSTGSTNTFLKDYNHSNDSVRVVVENFNLTLDAADADLGHLWRYSLTLVETA